MINLAKSHLAAAMRGFLALCLAALPAASEVGGVSQQQVAVTPTATAYVAGYCLGGVLAVPNMLTVQGPGGTVLAGFTFVDPAGQTAANDAMSLLIFNAAPTGTYTDHAACAVAAADQPHLVGLAIVAAANCLAIASSATVCQTEPNIPVNAAMPIGSSNLWVVPIITATPTYGTTTLYFNFAATPYR
jgi:hypothetical protein